MFHPEFIGAFSGTRCAVSIGDVGISPLVLVVDDSADARDLYGEYLKTCGFRVLTAQDGVEALRTAKAEWPAAIVMDLAMPRMDGWEAIRRLRADPMTADIPIVAVSAFAFGPETSAARDAGADLCLSKPCLPPQVARVVRAMIAGSSARASH
jgi:CheY-like chemotaxis protein